MKSSLALASIIAAVTFAATVRVCADDDATVDARFRKVALDNKCDDPMELAVTPDGRVLYIERGGGVKIWKPATKSTIVSAKRFLLRKCYGRQGDD